MTDEFTLNVGVNPGYFHDNPLDGDRVSLVVSIWLKAAEEEFRQSGYFIGCVVTLAKTVYRTEWGCPKEGEDTVVITGLRNPYFQRSSSEWIEATERVCQAVTKSLGQTTSYLTFRETQFRYLKPQV